MKQCPNTYYIAVIENTDTKKIVAAASLILEQKFIHEIAMVRNLTFAQFCLLFKSLCSQTLFNLSLVLASTHFRMNN